jgi:RNA polymerase sigma-70 factor (ECF subfamily)
LTDTALIEQVVSGDREAFGELVRRHQGVVCGLAYHELGNFADAEDVAQQAFLTAYQRLHQLREPSRFAGWLREIVRNECRMCQRRRHESGGLDEVGESLPSHDVSPEQASVRREVQQRVRDAIGALSPANRLAVTLYYLDGQSCEEVAAFLGVSAGTVRTRLHRARNELREEMMDMVGEGLTKQKPGQEFEKAVRLRVPVRVVETVEHTLPVRAEDTVVVYTDFLSSRIRVQGAGDTVLRVEARKMLFGQSAGEAHERSRQIRVEAERRRDVGAAGPHRGQVMRGVGFDGQTYQPVYVAAAEEWARRMQMWRREKPLTRVLDEALAGEVITVVGAADGLEFITVPHLETLKAHGDFVTSYSEKGWALGPAGNVELAVSVPACRYLVLVGGQHVEVEGVEADLVVLGGPSLSCRVTRVQGSVFIYDGAPELLEGVSGSVWISDLCHHRGVSWGESALRREGPVPKARIRDVSGRTHVACWQLDLDLRRLHGGADILNEFGRTKLLVAKPTGRVRPVRVKSVSGDVHVTLTPEAHDQLKVGVWTECGCIDRGRWPLARGGYNTERETYLGTEPSSPGTEPSSTRTHVQVRTRAGNVRVVRTERLRLPSRPARTHARRCPSPT